ILYTYNPAYNSLYALFPKYPGNNQLLLKDLQLPANTVISFLATKEKVQWEQKGNDVVVSLPSYDPNRIKAPYAYVIKIEDFGKFARKPVINVSLRKESFNKIISFAKEANQEIRYTLDGSEPNIHSDLYATPIMLKKSATVKAISIFPAALPSEAATKDIQIYEWKSPEKPKSIKS